MWSSTKLARCRPESKAEYAWLYGAADANGNIELETPQVLYSKAYAIRPEFTFTQFLAVLEDFHANGLLFEWEENGKRYGHWTGSDQPGRLPPKPHRARYDNIRVSRAFSAEDPEVLKYIADSMTRRRAEAPLFAGVKPRAELPAVAGSRVIDAEFVDETAPPKSSLLLNQRAATAAQAAVNTGDGRIPFWKEFWSLYPEARRGSYSDTCAAFMQNCPDVGSAEETVESLKRWLVSSEWRDGRIPNSEKFFLKAKYMAAPLEGGSNGGTARIGATANEQLDIVRRNLSAGLPSRRNQN